MSRTCAVLVLLTLCMIDPETLAQRQSSSPPPVVGRSKVATTYGIVAASQPLAARAGVQVLERGGNAIDAAIATNAVMGLVEPAMNGIGGDLFAIVYEARTGKLYGLNSGGWAPTGLTPAFLKSKGIDRMPGHGIYSVTVPGAVAGWDAMRTRFGKLPMSDILAPAIFYADRGISGDGCDRERVEWLIRGARRGAERSEDLSRRRPRSQGGRPLQESRSREVAAPDCGERRGRLLRREDRRRHSRDLAR